MTQFKIIAIGDYFMSNANHYKKKGQKEIVAPITLKEENN